MDISLASAGAPPPPELFPPTNDLRDLIRPYNVDLHDATEPIPTNAWWGNLLAWDPHSRRDSDPIFANPYVYHIAQARRGVSIGYLHQYRTDGPIDVNGAIKYYFYPATVKNLILSAVEWDAQTHVAAQIESWDDLGCTVDLTGSSSSKWNPETTPTQHVRGYLSNGNAFTTLEFYGQLHAKIETDHHILRVNDQPYVEGQTIQSTTTPASFELELNNGQKWVLYFFPDTETAFPGVASTIQLRMYQNSLRTMKPFDGVVQAAFVSSEKSRQQDPDDERSVLALYRNVAGVYPVGASLFVETGGAAFGYNWTLKDVRNEALGQCLATRTHLHFALTHLQLMMDSTLVVHQPDLVLWSHTRGPMQAYTLRGDGDGRLQWRFIPPKEISDAVDAQAGQLVPIGSAVPAQVVQEFHLLDVVTREIVHADWNLPHEGSYYFKGKALQKFATIVLVAKQLSHSTNPELQPVFEQGLTKLRNVIKQFAKNKAAYPLVYDEVYKGIITSEALHKRDINVDFGNAVYNDHHYHYGYLITAAAMLLHLDGGSTTSDHRPEDYAELRVFVQTLIRDVVTTDAGDKFFPKFRLFNWFLGHSYSHGVTPMADGKDEESTSEEVNFLYGLSLYGQVTEQPSLRNLAKLMLKVNALAIQTYFLISDDKIGVIHPSSFGKNKVTGICFDNKCDYATWFSPARECIHGIQMIPVSPMLDVVRTRQFIREEWNQILSKLACVAQWEHHGTGWTSLLYSNAAVIIPDQAIQVLGKCPLDDGLSRSWALYMAATKLTTSQVSTSSRRQNDLKERLR